MKRILIMECTLGILCPLLLRAQSTDSIQNVSLSEIIVTESAAMRPLKKTSLPVLLLNKNLLDRQFNGNLMQTLSFTPGVRSLDIGSGFSKPMIRGLAFNRVVVSENGIKQEGQQWGADHGLEIDAFNMEEIRILKGPSSLLFGSDAMGGVIEILAPSFPSNDQLFGEVSLLGKSTNEQIGASLLLGLKKGHWLGRIRYSEQQYGDYRVPTDTVVYLTQKMPLYGRKMKNTAGFERNANLFVAYHHPDYQANYGMSNVYQKNGFFPGAHGIPDISRLEDDGNSRNIELPFSRVNHLKLSTHQQYRRDQIIWSTDIGYQYNHREEWSAFHTHYSTQSLPQKDPDKELLFRLHSLSVDLKARIIHSSSFEDTWGFQTQYQKNHIGGYGFLLPAYDRQTLGAFWLGNWRPSSQLTVSLGARYDYGRIQIDAFYNPYLAAYLQQQGYDATVIERYSWSAQAVSRGLSDFSGALGFVWNPSSHHLFKLNLGRSFRLPGANELAANGVHHGTFRHEQGNANLHSERGWQADLDYHYQSDRLKLEVSPFMNLFQNYIYLNPTGEWSVLPHTGQIYRYEEARALLTGAELDLNLQLSTRWHYRLSGEYLYTYNRDVQTALSFSAPATLRNRLTFQQKSLELYTELQSIAKQHRVARNEEATDGAQLWHMGAFFQFKWGNSEWNLNLSVQNLLNTKYYNHLSFYRKVEIPEPGRNFQLSLKVPFKTVLK